MQIRMFRTRGAGQDFRHSGITNNINAKQKQPTHLGTKKQDHDNDGANCHSKGCHNSTSSNTDDNNSNNDQQHKTTAAATAATTTATTTAQPTTATQNRKQNANSLINKIQLTETDAAKRNKEKKLQQKTRHQGNLYLEGDGLRRINLV